MTTTIPAGPRRLARGLLLALALGGLAGCAAVSALSGASTPLDAYALTPLAGGGGGGGSRHVVVEAPTTSGAIATDRILVKPSRLQAAYLPGARWVDPAPVLVQTLLVQSLQASGGFRLVGRTPVGLFPDVTVLTEIRAFQAEPGPPEGPLYLVRVALTLTLVRESDGAIVGARNLEATAAAASDAPIVIAAAFDAAMAQALREAVAFVAGGGVA
jgi:cholesterol transport system auxiliary component